MMTAVVALEQRHSNFTLGDCISVFPGQCSCDICQAVGSSVEQCFHPSFVCMHIPAAHRLSSGKNQWLNGDQELVT